MCIDSEAEPDEESELLCVSHGRRHSDFQTGLIISYEAMLVTVDVKNSFAHAVGRRIAPTVVDMTAVETLNQIADETAGIPELQQRTCAASGTGTKHPYLPKVADRADAISQQQSGPLYDNNSGGGTSTRLPSLFLRRW